MPAYQQKLSQFVPINHPQKLKQNDVNIYELGLLKDDVIGIQSVKDSNRTQRTNF